SLAGHAVDHRYRSGESGFRLLAIAGGDGFLYVLDMRTHERTLCHVAFTAGNELAGTLARLSSGCHRLSCTIRRSKWVVQRAIIGIFAAFVNYRTSFAS